LLLLLLLLEEENSMCKCVCRMAEG
jgi:hypothetical protein